MTTDIKNKSENSDSCNSKQCIGMDNDCSFVKNDNTPSGFLIIPGSGKLTEYPVDPNIKADVTNNDFLDYFQNFDVCPPIYSGTVCIKDCCEFKAAENINFINGDLILGDPSASVCSIVLTSPNVKSTGTEAIDIFPNLLGINGNLYIINTIYSKITGFHKLKYVTGSIIIVNNIDLIQMPSFPSLLNVSAKLVASVPAVVGPPPVPFIPAKCDPGAIIIANNGSLRKIIGFESLRQVKNGIFISDNSCLTHICGFVHLYRTDRIVIDNNEKLSKIIGFCYIDDINIGLYIVDNNSAGDNDLIIQAFTNLESANRVILIGNNFLKHFKLDSLKRIEREFIVRSNLKLEELSALSLFAVDSLYLENNKNLVVIDFPQLVEVNKSININSNCSLSILNTFDKLKRVGASIIIADNKQLCEIKGFNELKYIGSKCTVRPNNNINVDVVSCNCTANFGPDWSSLFVRDGCVIVIDTFVVTFYDGDSLCDCNSVFPCAYGNLPSEFFDLTCETIQSCSTILPPVTSVEVLEVSLVIFRNSRLKSISGFACLKHVQGSIYIIYNIMLAFIHAFGQLAFAVDIWIRNNSNIKYITGFNNLLYVRTLVILETVCMINLDNLKSMEFAQHIYLESKTSKAIKYPKNPIDSVWSFALYYSFEN